MPNPHFEDFVGAVYDVDDTMLSNYPDDGNPYNLHERSRLAAIQAVGSELGHEALLGVTGEENQAAFRDAPTHTVDAAVWAILHRYGIAGQEELIADHPVLMAIIARKATLHMDLLLNAGVEVRGTSALVLGLEQNGLQDKQAIASGARLDEIQAFLKKYDLADVFPRQRTVARGDYTHPKPHPEPFDKGFLTLGLTDTAEIRSRTLAVEDDPKGYLSAYRAGLYVCALTTRFPADAFRLDGHLPKIITADMQELGEQIGLLKPYTL